jgi:hypothetical protein
MTRGYLRVANSSNVECYIARAHVLSGSANDLLVTPGGVWRKEDREEDSVGAARVCGSTRRSREPFYQGPYGTWEEFS